MKLLQDDEWSRWSDREIAKQTAVSNTYVSKLRDELRFVTVNVDSEDRTYRTKHGTVSTMRTGNIGVPLRPTKCPNCR
ncbi:hypothetical protein V1289_007057 [Bradyrhizobium sp. AZCC 2289]